MKQKHSTEKKDKYERQKLIDSHITDKGLQSTTATTTRTTRSLIPRTKLEI